MVVPAVRTESARPRISGGARLAATEEATGVNTAAPEAAITLIKSNSEKSGTTAAAALALANKSSAPTSRRFLGTPLVAATRIGEATAAVTANTVTKSPAAATETESSRAMSRSTPVTTYAPVPTAKEPKDRVRMRAPILLLLEDLLLRRWFRVPSSTPRLAVILTQLIVLVREFRPLSRPLPASRANFLEPRNAEVQARRIPLLVLLR